MLVDITKIKMDGRIRKDFGNIEELAEDIKRNGLINPPVVIPEDDGTFTLLTGERRIRAMKHLGYQQIEVRTWGKLSDADKLEVEISENEQRKPFSTRERYEMFVRRYEYLKENVHSSARKPINQAAFDAGISRNEVPKVREILTHESELDPQMIADWDDRKLSTAALYRELKSKLASAEEQLATAEEERISAEREAMQARSDVRAQDTLIERMEQQIEGLQAQIDGGGLSEEEKREYVNRITVLSRSNRDLLDKYNRAIEDSRDEREKMRKQLVEATNPKFSDKMRSDIFFFRERCANFIKDNGGYAYLAEELSKLPDAERASFTESVRAIYAWSSNIMNYLEEAHNG